MSHRVIVTGSQGWTDEARIRAVLRQVWQAAPGAVLVSGGCPRGADAIAERAWHSFGGQVERVRPVWRSGGVLNRRAGFDRNETMVLRGGSLCVGFILPCGKLGCLGRPPDRGLEYHGTHGSVHCADFAEDHGILVRRFAPILAA